jgi:hypothetical protein
VAAVLVACRGNDLVWVVSGRKDYRRLSMAAATNIMSSLLRSNEVFLFKDGRASYDGFGRNVCYLDDR